MSGQNVLSAVAKWIGLPVEIICWLIVLIHAYTGATLLTLSLWAYSFSPVIPAATLLALNSVLGIIFSRKIIPTLKAQCNKCNSDKIETILFEGQCQNCSTIYSFRRK